MIPGANITGIVRAPINQVWQVFRPFGPETLKWWHIYESLTLKPPGKDEVGAVRSCKIQGREYEHTLELRDDENYILKYSSVPLEPLISSLKKSSLTVQMSAKDENETIVRWYCENDVDRTGAKKVAKIQQATYQTAIKSLDTYFNPTIGKLEVTLIQGIDLLKTSQLFLDPYAIVILDNGEPQESPVIYRTRQPIWQEKFSFDLIESNEKLYFSIWDANFGRDDLIGSTEIELREIVAGKLTRKTLSLDSGNSGKIVVSLLLSLDSGENRLPPTEEMEMERKFDFLEKLLLYTKKQVMTVVEQVPGGVDQKYEYEKYPRLKHKPDLPLEKLPPMVKGLPPGQQIPPEQAASLLQRTIEYVYSQAGFFLRLEEILAAKGDPWTAYYSDPWVKPPVKIPEIWREDAEFCRQFIQGVNPMRISVCQDKKEIPEDLAGLTTPQGESIDLLIAAKRLFYLDYQELKGIEELQNKVFYEPYVLIYRELLENGKSQLNLLGIRLNPNQIYTKNSPANKYILAKMHVQCADCQYHQFVYHLALTHLVIEPFVISHHNSFPKTHAIGQILAPHFRGSLGINYLARQTLISPVAPFTDPNFATGTGGGLELILKLWENWDFEKMSFPEQLKTRGFDEAGSDGVEDFYFRDDGFKIWNAIKEYVTNVVEIEYNRDRAVAEDSVIQNWAAETADPEKGSVPGFPKNIASKEVLIGTLTNIIFLASAQHSAINFSQYQYLGYIPNRPNVLYKGIPEGTEDVSLDYVLKEALQPYKDAHFQTFFSRLLSTHSLHPIGNLPAPEAEKLHGVHAVFIAKLNLIATEIERRNSELEKQGKIPYPYLSPVQIATSIDT